jgi:hypothetical protein
MRRVSGWLRNPGRFLLRERTYSVEEMESRSVVFSLNKHIKFSPPDVCNIHIYQVPNFAMKAWDSLKRSTLLNRLYKKSRCAIDLYNVLITYRWYPNANFLVASVKLRTIKNSPIPEALLYVLYAIWPCVSSKILTPHPPLPLASVSSPQGGGYTLAGRWGVGEVNILEDARHWIGLLQYNLSTHTSAHIHTSLLLLCCISWGVGNGGKID